MNNSDRPQPKYAQTESSELVPNCILEVKWSCRWEVFRRLQGLGIECQCSTNEPLLVYLHSPVTIVQIWSVLRQCGASRPNLINWLESCWETQSDTVNYDRERQLKESKKKNIR